MAAVDRNSDGSYDALDSGGFGKDYHGQDVFGERIGRTGIGGNHFGGFEEGHFGFDDDKYKDMTKDQYSAFLEKQAGYNSVAKGSGNESSGNESSFDGSDKSSEEEAGSGMRDDIRDLNAESSEENSNVGSLDTSMLVGENEDEKEKSSFTDKMEPEKSSSTDKMEPEKSKELEEDLEKSRQKAEKSRQKAENEQKNYDELKETRKSLEKNIKDIKPSVVSSILDAIGMNKGYQEDRLTPGLADMKANLNKMADTYGIEHEDFNNVKVKDLNKAVSELLDKIDKHFSDRVQKAQDEAQKAQSDYDTLKSSFIEKTKSSFTDKMEESKEEAKAGPNMSKATVGESDYLTKANKDSTKKEAPSRNDFPNHIANTLKGAADTIADNTTAKALGIQSLEDFAKEKGIDPNKFSTMKAYQSYQNKQIMKALPNLMKKVGSYFTERIKDFFDPSQLPERIRNTLARYNAATLVGAAILSIQSGAGIQASIDQALTMVDPEDQPDVSDYLEDVLNDEGTVADLSNAFDDALTPEQTSDTAELDESIVNIGRKDNTDYDDFNAGLGTTSDADVKVFIARNVKADPILRRMISKMGK